MVESTVFYIAGGLTVLFILLMIIQPSPVASAICLVASFFTLAIVYITLSAHFVAALQILIYAGAIMVLFVFVIMLLNLKDDELVQDRFSVRNVVVFFLGVGLLGIGLFGFLSWVILEVPQVALMPLAPDFGEVREVSKLMLSDYAVPFEVLSLLLLVGLIGAVVLGRRVDP